MVKTSQAVKALWALVVVFTGGAAAVFFCVEKPFWPGLTIFGSLAMFLTIIALTHNLVFSAHYGRPLAPPDLKDGEYTIRPLGINHGPRMFLIWEGNLKSEDGLRVVTDSQFYFPSISEGVPAGTVITITLETKITLVRATSGTTRNRERIITARWLVGGAERITNRSISL